MEHEKAVVQESLRQSADEVTQQLAQATTTNSQLEREKEVSLGCNEQDESQEQEMGKTSL